MKVITAPNEYSLKEKEISVFLAGGITNCPKWQDDIINRLEWLSTENLVVFNPRRDNFPINDKNAAYRQIEWEFNQLEKVDIFSIYFTSGISDQPICMYELGRNLVKMQMRFPKDWENRIIISVEDGYKRKQDVIIQSELACGKKLSINTQISEDILKDYHAEQIVKAYKNQLLF